MKRFYTVLLIVAAAGSLLLAHTAVQSGHRSHASRNEFSRSVHAVQVVQQDAVFSSDRGTGFTIMTRKYKPRSTQPVSLLETLSLQKNGTVEYDPDCSLVPLYRRMIDRSRLIVPAMVLGRSVTAVERTLFSELNSLLTLNKA